MRLRPYSPVTTGACSSASWSCKGKKLCQHVVDTQYVLMELETHLLDLERTGDIMSYQNNYAIPLINTEPITAVSCRQKMSVEEFGTYYGTLFQKIAREQLHPSGKVMALYHDKEFDPAYSDIELAVSITEADKANRIIPGGSAPLPRITALIPACQMLTEP